MCLSAGILMVSSAQKEKKKIIRDLTTAVLARKPKMCNFIEWKDMKIVYKRFGVFLVLHAVTCDA